MSSSAALQPLTGKFYTYFRVKWTFLTFLCIFELGSLLCGVSTNSKFLICGRAVAGLGGSGLVNGALTIIAASAPIEKRPGMESRLFLTWTWEKANCQIQL